MVRGKANKNLLMAVYHGRNYVRNGKYVVNHIGATTYISFDDLKPAEIAAIAKLKKTITGKN